MIDTDEKTGFPMATRHCLPKSGCFSPGTGARTIQEEPDHHAENEDHEE